MTEKISICPSCHSGEDVMGYTEQRQQGFRSVLLVTGARMLWVMQTSGKDFNLSLSQKQGCCWMIQNDGKDFDLSLSQIGEDVVR